MKTSKKLLLALLAFIVIINLYFIVMVRVHMEGAYKATQSLPKINFDKGQMVEKDFSYEFNKIKVDFPCSITYMKNSENKVNVRTFSGILEKINYEVINNELVIKMDEGMSFKNMINIELYSDSLIEINLEEGARLESDLIDVENLIVNLDNSVFNSTVKTGKLVLNLSNSSMATVEGVTDNLNINQSGNNNIIYTSALKISGQ